MTYGCTHNDPQDSCLWCSDEVVDRSQEIMETWDSGGTVGGYSASDFDSYREKQDKAHELAFDEFEAKHEPDWQSMAEGMREAQATRIGNRYEP